MCPSSRVGPLHPANKGPLAGRRLQGLLSLEWLSAFFPEYSREGVALCNCASELATKSGAGSPPPQAHAQGSWLQSRESPEVRNWFFLHFSIPRSVIFFLVQIQSYTSTASFSSFCLSTEGDPSPQFLCCTFSLPVFNHAPMSRQVVPMAPWRCFCHFVAWIQVLRPQYAVFEGRSNFGSPTSSPCWLLCLLHCIFIAKYEVHDKIWEAFICKVELIEQECLGKKC